VTHISIGEHRVSTRTETETSTQSQARAGNNIRIGVQLWPGGAPSYHSWRDAVLRAEDLGTDVIFGYVHRNPACERLWPYPERERRRCLSTPTTYLRQPDAQIGGRFTLRAKNTGHYIPTVTANICSDLYADELDQVATNLYPLHVTEAANSTTTGHEPDRPNQS
jgi:hypothetical protein